MQKQQRMESGPPSLAPDHATAQITAFKQHMETALREAQEQNPANALKAVQRAATAFEQLVRYLARRASGRRARVDVQALHQPLGASRDRLAAGSWGEAIPQLRQMRLAGLVIISGLGGQIPDADMAGDGTSCTTCGNGAASSDGLRPLRKHDWRRRSPRHS